MNLVKIADMLKNAPDQALIQEMQNPTGTAPSYMVLSELQRRKKLRGASMNPEPQTSVAEDMEAETLQANQMGIGSMMPQVQQPQQAPVGMAQGGAVRGYADGGAVDYQDDLPWDERMRMWREMTGFGRMAPAAPAPVQAQPTFPGAAAAQVRAADNRIIAANPDLTKVRPQAPVTPRTSAQAGIASVGTPKQAAPESTDYSVNPLLDELKGYRKELAAAYKNQAEAYKQQAEEIKNAKSSDVAMALMQAGFGIMGGRDQNAAVNIGQGAMPAIQQYVGMDRARREQLQKLALGQGALGIEQLGAQMKGVTAEGELGLGGEKMDIARRSADADMIRARAAAAGVANQASQWKLENAKNKVDQQRAATLINYLKTDGLNIDEPTKAAYVSEINRLLGVSGTMSGIPQGVKVTPIK